MAGDTLRLSLRCDESAPRAVRDAMAALRCPGSVLGDAMLVASELVTNAVRHSGGGAGDVLQVEVQVQPERVRLTVSDPGASGNSAEPYRAELPFGGLGLRLVEQLSSSWGADRRPTGRHLVWAEIPLPADDPPPARA